MKNSKIISMILIFIGTMVFGFSLIANSILIAPNALIKESREAVESLGIFKFNSIVMAVSFILVFVGAIILITEYVLSVKNRKE